MPSRTLGLKAGHKLRALSYKGHSHLKLVSRSTPVSKCTLYHKRVVASLYMQLPDKGSILLPGKYFGVTMET